MIPIAWRGVRVAEMRFWLSWFFVSVDLFLLPISHINSTICFKSCIQIEYELINQNNKLKILNARHASAFVQFMSGWVGMELSAANCRDRSIAWISKPSSSTAEGSLQLRRGIAVINERTLLTNSLRFLCISFCIQFKAISLQCTSLFCSFRCTSYLLQEWFDNYRIWVWKMCFLLKFAPESISPERGQTFPPGGVDWT